MSAGVNARRSSNDLITRGPFDDKGQCNNPSVGVEAERVLAQGAPDVPLNPFKYPLCYTHARAHARTDQALTPSASARASVPSIPFGIGFFPRFRLAIEIASRR